MYPRCKTPSSMGTPSVYSLQSLNLNASRVTLRSSNLRSARSVKSLRLPWYRRPILKDAVFTNTQRGSLVFAVYSLLLSIFTLATSAFDWYCLFMASLGSIHYGHFLINYEFVYVGSTWVRNLLLFFSIFSILAAAVVLVTSIILISALRQEHEKRMISWLYSFAVFVVFRFVAWVFCSIANDPMYVYNFSMIIFGAILSIANVYGWILVYSLFLELCDLSKLEDQAHLRIGTLNSLNGSTTNSMYGSSYTITPRSEIYSIP